MALLMGVMYIAYSDVVPYRSLIVAFILFFVFAALTHKFGHKHAWHRKYLDYRALAEGLRVQFYWAAAGVTAATNRNSHTTIFCSRRMPISGGFGMSCESPGWHAMPRLIVNSHYFGHPQDRWSGCLNVRASLTHSQ